MLQNFTDDLQEISNLTVDLQRKFLQLQEDLKSQQVKHNKEHLAFCLTLIELLDFIEQLHDFSKDPLLGKILRRLSNILKEKNISEILTDTVEVGMVKVIETRCIEGLSDGKILEIVRKGYKLGNNVLRPSEVITSLRT